MKRTPLILVIIFLLMLSILAFLIATAPQTTDVTLAECVFADGDSCDRLPQITGSNLDTYTVTLPNAINTDYALVVMPFSRDQQTAAADWLPVFQEIAKNDDRLSFYSLAVLVVEIPFRPLVIGGLTVAITDPELRQAVVLAFVEDFDQQQILNALNVENTDEMLVLLIAQNGEVIWQGTGNYDEATAEALRAAIPNDE